MSFQEAIEDYRFLRNRGYPTKAALKLVGDRYRLNRMERNCLFRGVVSDRHCARRLPKIRSAAEIHGQSLGIDWYNVLITVESYLKGAPVFLSDDGVLRDSAGIHGSYRPGKVTPQVVDSILQILEELRPAKIELFLDAPISHSGEMASTLRRKLETLPVQTSVTTAPTADYALKNYPGIAATSDSNIMDGQVENIFDLSRHVLERRFGYRAVKLTNRII